jgi:CDP-diacylglycerol---glycerol-3-phosphate 3-phosphatidyltransferase
MSHRLWNIPNALSVSRLPLAVGLFVAITYQQWWVGLVCMTVAALTDWADGWWARRFGPLTPVGRSLDPLTDKVLICGAFIFLLPVPNSGLHAWMVTAVISRELIVTGLRGIVESSGRQFPADWFGKVKMVLQCVVLIGILLQQSLLGMESGYAATLGPWVVGLIWATMIATLGSMVQYLWRAWMLMG